MAGGLPFPPSSMVLPWLRGWRGIAAHVKFLTGLDALARIEYLRYNCLLGWNTTLVNVIVSCGQQIFFRVKAAPDETNRQTGYLQWVIRLFPPLLEGKMKIVCRAGCSAVKYLRLIYRKGWLNLQEARREVMEVEAKLRELVY